MSRQNKQLQTGKFLSKVLAVASSLALALFLGVGTYLLTIDNAAAEAEAATTNGTDSAEVEVDVNIPTVLSLAAYPFGDHSAETHLVTLSPVANGPLVTSMLDLVVRTNVMTGYQLTIEDTDTVNDMTSTTNSADIIPALAAATNTAGFPANYWGYSVGEYNTNSSEFQAVPVSTPTLIAESDSLLPGDGETTVVTFGVKTDNGTPNGVYEDEVEFTASPKLLPKTYKLLIHYRFEDGTEAAPDYSVSLDANADYSVDSPEVTGYYPNQATVSGNIGTDSLVVTVIYSQYRSVTVKYIYEDGTSAGDDAVKTGLKAGDTYNILTPTLAGYYPDQDAVSGTVADQNVVVTVTYKKYYTATLKFVDEAGTEIKTAETQTNLKTGDTYSFDIPTIAGYYTDQTGPLTGTIANGNVSLTVTYKKYYKVTVSFVYEDGTTASAQVVEDNLKTGDAYNVPAPAISGYYPDQDAVSGTITNQDVTATITYKKYYTATVTYVYEDGTTASPTQTQTNLKSGDSYNFTVPAITGYYADTTGPITGNIGTADFSKTVTYKKYRTMTVYYKDTSGNTLKAATTQNNLKTGETYTVTAPDISGYKPKQTTYTGIVPANDFSVTVEYTAADLSNLPSGTKMQDFGGVCAATTTPSASETTVPEATLVDGRDNKSYKVRKLADGKCWMVQDLDFRLNTSTTLNPDTTDLPTGTTWTPNNTTQTSTGTTWETPSPTTARSYTNGTRTYYNWYAATGGTTNASTTSGDAPGSICPKGWTLPSSADYVNLITTTYNIPNSSSGSIQLRSAPLGFEYTGGYTYHDGLLVSVGSEGHYWSRSTYSSERADYFLFFASSGGAYVVPQNNGVRGNGYAVRCVAR